MMTEETSKILLKSETQRLRQETGAGVHSSKNEVLRYTTSIDSSSEPLKQKAKH